jgi:SAM-dependent methyltransferase
MLFEEYHHVSGASQGNVEHLKKVSEIINERVKNKPIKIFEVGCNDGTLLKFLQLFSHEVAGCDPAKNLAPEKNLRVYSDFFGVGAAEKIRAETGTFDFIVGLNVFAHNADFIDMLKGSAVLLTETGTVMIEVAYAPLTICDGNFDTIYHEHVCSYTLISLTNVLRKAGLRIYDAEIIETQGGSIRVFAQHDYNNSIITDNYTGIIKREQEDGLNNIGYYKSLQSKIEQKSAVIKDFLGDVVRQNRRMLIMGSPARGVVTMNVCGIDVAAQSLVVDDTKEKQGKLMPGVHIPICAWEDVDFSNFEIALILSWNYADSLVDRLRKTDFSGRIFAPFPFLKEIPYRDLK